MSDDEVQPFVHPANPSTSTFQSDIFKGKVAFVTGGGSGICELDLPCLSPSLFRLAGLLLLMLICMAPRPSGTHASRMYLIYRHTTPHYARLPHALFYDEWAY